MSLNNIRNPSDKAKVGANRSASFSNSMHGRGYKRRIKWFGITPIVFLFLGVVFLGNARSDHFHPTLVLLALLSFVASPVLAIIGVVLRARGKPLSTGLLAVLVILFLSAVTAISVRSLAVFCLPYLYTPPAISPENIGVYRNCIRFARNHDGDTTLKLARGLRVLVNGKTYMLSPANPVERNRVRRVFSEAEIEEMENLCDQLFQVGCVLLQRDNDMLLFHKWSNSILPEPLSEFFRIWPTGPGVLYSLNGSEPNKVESGVVCDKRPFTKIAGNWYMSRRLMLAGPRSDAPASIPTSFIDHSLRLARIDPNDLELH